MRGAGIHCLRADCFDLMGEWWIDMITIILPEWLVIMLGVAVALSVLASCLNIYLWHLKRKIKKLQIKMIRSR